jgi:hypothetical protein
MSQEARTCAIMSPYLALRRTNVPAAARRQDPRRFPAFVGRSVGFLLQPLGSSRLAPGGLAARSPATDGPSMSPCHPVESCRRRTEFIEFSALNPSRRQAIPCSFALRGPSEFGHSPAFTGKLSEFFRGTHWQFSLCRIPVISNVRLHFVEAPRGRRSHRLLQASRSNIGVTHEFDAFK